MKHVKQMLPSEYSLLFEIAQCKAECEFLVGDDSVRDFLHDFEELVEDVLVGKNSLIVGD